MPEALSSDILAEINRLTQGDRDLVDIFKELHKNPELSFKETVTSDKVAEELRKLPFDVKDGIITKIPEFPDIVPEAGKSTHTGVVGILRNGDGPTVMYRADMDALAVQETAEKPIADGYASTVDGMMHACGHDAHVTWMLGAAKIMATHPDWWSGTLVVLAQPAEEVLLGAQEMLKVGLYEDQIVPFPEHLIALHTGPLRTGQVSHAAGVRMAGSEQFDVIFHGVGGHGSQPHLTKDPVVMAALAVVEYQLIISRTIDPQEAAVLTVGAIQAGTANNIIPAEARVKINTRFFDNKIRDHIYDGVKSVSTSIARAYGITEDKLPDKLPEIVPARGENDENRVWVGCLENHNGLVAQIAPSLAALPCVTEVLDNFPPVMGSEDCQELIPKDREIALDYMIVGTADPSLFDDLQDGSYPFTNHNGDYAVDLNAIPVGTAIAVTSLLEAFRL